MIQEIAYIVLVPKSEETNGKKFAEQLKTLPSNNLQGVIDHIKSRYDGDLNKVEIHLLTDFVNIHNNGYINSDEWYISYVYILV